MKTYSYYVLFLLVVFCGCSRPTELTSPDGNIKLVFNLNEAGAMTYGVSVGGKPFITPSVMGFEGRDGLNLSKDFQIENTEFTTKDETWTQPWGENKSIRNHINIWFRVDSIKYYWFCTLSAIFRSSSTVNCSLNIWKLTPFFASPSNHATYALFSSCMVMPG